MSNKNNIKDNLQEIFDKNNNYNQILSKIERKSHMKKNIWLKYSLVSICLLAIITCFMINKDNNENNTFTTTKNNTITINKLKDMSENLLDADVKINSNIKIEESFSEYIFIDNIKVSNDLNLNSKYLVYTKRSYDTIEEYKNAPYDVLHDYVLQYEKTLNGAVEKTINITFSKDFKPLRDCFIDNLKISKINNTELTIANYNDMYIAIFNYNNLNFDIETKGISEIELVDLLESIIK